MLHSDTPHSSFWDRLKTRHDYAMDAPEQRFQRHLTTGREIGASAVFWPTMNFEKNLLYREPIRDASGTLMRGESGNILTYAPKDNAIAIAYRLGTNVLFKQYFAQYARAFSVAFNTNRNFRHTVEAGNDLLALSQTAQHLDNAPRPLVQEIRHAMQSPVHDMVNRSIAANRLLTRFADGEMEVTPENIATLKRELDGLSTLAQEKSGAMRSMMAMRAYASHTPDTMPEDLEEFSRPSGFIRDVVKQGKITSMRQAQILLSFAAGLMSEGAVPLTQEQLFIPQEHIYITPAQSVNMGRFISDTMHARNFALNQDAQGRPLVPDVPTGAILKTHHSANGDTSYAPINEKELAEFTTALLGYMKTELGAPMQKLMGFADEHYTDIQHILLGNPKELRSYHDELKTALAESLPKPAPNPIANSNTPLLTTPWQQRIKPQNNVDRALALPADVWKNGNLLYDHLTRPEARHEMHKLFSRGVATYALFFPLGLVSNALLGFTKRDANWKHIPLTRENFKKHGPGLLITPQSLKSELFQMMVYPLVESIGSVEMVELARYPRMITHQAAKHMDDILLAGVKTAALHDEAFQAGIAALEQSNPAEEVLKKHPKYRKVMQAAEGRKSLESADDYALLAEYYHAVSDQVGKDAAQVFSPYISKDQSFKDVLHNVTHKPIARVSEAALSLAFLRSVTALNQKNILWLEYLPPEVANLDHKQIGELAHYMDAQAESAGLVVYNPKTMKAPGIKPGELVQRDKKTGAVHRAGEEDIIRLANVGMEKLRTVMVRKDFEAVTEGDWSRRYTEATEKLLFAPTHFAAVPAKESSETPEKPTSNAPATPWNTESIALPGQRNKLVKAAQYAVRPEAQHQMHKLFWRMLFTRALYTPINISENILWKHKITIDRNAPLGTQMTQFFGSANVKQSMWTLASFPVTFSYGITAAWEFGSYLFGKQQQAVEQSEASSGYIGAAIKASARLDPKLNEHLASQEGTNPALLALQEKPEFRRMPEIFAKPTDERSEKEKALTEHFFAETGDALIQHSNAMLQHDGGVHGGTAQNMQKMISRPARDVAEATRKLAFAEAMIDMNQQYTEMLRYFDPEEQLIDTRHLAELSTFIHKQAIGAGFIIGKDQQQGVLLERTAQGKTQPVSEESLIRFANVVGDKLLKTVDTKNLDKAFNGKLAEGYLKATDRNSSKGL